MERRLVLTGLAVLAAGPALAQNSPAPPTDAPAAPAPAAPPPTPAPAPAMKIAPPLTTSGASGTHMKETIAVGSLSLLASRIAAQKVTTPMLKQFTAFEIAEQETIASVLKAMMMPDAAPIGTVKAPTDAELTANLDPAGKAAIDSLQKAGAGPAFERDYVRLQTEGHRKLLDIQETYLKTPDNMNETNVAKLARAQITEHLALLGDIEKHLKG